MPIFNSRVLMLTVGAVLATSACGGNATVPSGAAFAPGASAVVPIDTTSILKKLTKDVEIGSTVDRKNGDTGPRAISLARATFGLKKGQLLVCNFDDSAGTAGNGTTMEVLNPVPHSKPVTFTQSSKIEGCDGDAITATNQVYGAGMVSGLVSRFDQTASSRRRTVLPSRFRLTTPMHSAVRLMHPRTSTLRIPRPAELLSWRSSP